MQSIFIIKKEFKLSTYKSFFNFIFSGRLQDFLHLTLLFNINHFYHGRFY